MGHGVLSVLFDRALQAGDKVVSFRWDKCSDARPPRRAALDRLAALEVTCAGACLCVRLRMGKSLPDREKPARDLLQPQARVVVLPGRPQDVVGDSARASCSSE